MITHREAVRFFTSLNEQAKAYMKENGLVYPMIHVLTKGRALKVEVHCPSVLLVQNPSEDDLTDLTQIYDSMLGFKMESSEDEDNLQRVANEVATHYKPDAIGIVIGCNYNEYPGKAKPRTSPTDYDPDSVRVIHVSYWLRQHLYPLVLITPFTMKGKLTATVEDGREGYDVHFIETGWVPPKGLPLKVSPKLKNPFKL